MVNFDSPFIVPLGAFAVAIVWVIAQAFSASQARRMKADQRMAMVARGLPASEIELMLGPRVDDGRSVKDPLRSLGNARRSGIILCSVGVGLSLFFLALMVILQERDVLSGAAVGIIPLAIGIGFFIDYYLQKRELSRFGLEVGPDSPGGRNG
jgi:Flp pilus assembly protein TadB